MKCTKTKVKVTKRSSSARIKRHNFDSKFNGENLMWLCQMVTKTFEKNDSAKLVNT